MGEECILEMVHIFAICTFVLTNELSDGVETFDWLFVQLTKAVKSFGNTVAAARNPN